MTLLSIEHIVGTNGYYIDDQDLKIWSFKKNNKNGKLMKGYYNKDGYLIYNFKVNGKYKHILYHHIIVKMFIKKDFNSKIEEIDHKNHDNNDNSIDNLCVVSRIENQRNMSRSRTGKQFNFVDNIGRSLIINEEAKIYYSLEYDKFFMYIEHTNKFKELHEHIHKGYPCIKYSYNNKKHSFYTTKFRKNLNKK